MKCVKLSRGCAAETSKLVAKKRKHQDAVLSKC